MALAALAIAERPRVRETSERASLTDELRAVARAPGVAWVYAAGILITFMVGALQHWGVEFIVRHHYGGAAEASARVGVTFAPVVFAGVVGAVGGSVLADQAERRLPGRGRLLVVALGPLMGAPFVGLAIWTSSLPLLYASLAIGTGLNAAYIGPVLATLHDVVGAKARATATGVYFFLVHFLGDAISPTVVGFISDQTGSLRVGTSVAAAAAVAGGLCALIGVRRLGSIAAQGARAARSDDAPR
jgi:MFS family permease